MPDKKVLSKLIKKPLSIEKQVEKLQEKGLKIDDVERAKRILLSTNYYYFTGYLHKYKVITEDCVEYYETDLTFEEVYKIIQFDMHLRSIFLQAVDYIERDIKTKIAYYLAMDDPIDGSINYLYSEYFISKLPTEDYKVEKDKKFLIDNTRYKHNEFIKFYESEYTKKAANSTFIKHHCEKYWGCLPIWAAIEILTIGNIHNLYKNVLPTKIMKEVAREYEISTDLMSNYLRGLSIFRNLLAHNVRLFDESTSHTPMTNRRDILKKTNLIYDYVYILKNLTSDADFWNCTIITQLDLAFTNDLFKKVSSDRWGFRSDWRDKLLKRCQ
ncbi:Abi family protein [Proteiniclasticum ruminis]|uniref:Abi family protein n=1 Tax=Proteiniclasticum ruminis TaxID=398199 RepID=UPI00138DF4C5|nr:Abi family protein [Proteiniclasticum ruminis]